MKLFNNIKIASFVDRIMGREEDDSFKPKATAGALGVLGGSSVAELGASALLGKSVGGRKIQELENNPQIFDRAISSMRENQNLNSEFSRVGGDFMPDGGKSYEAGYNRNIDKIIHTDNTGKHLLLHEAGHGSGQDSAFNRGLGSVAHALRGHRTAGLGLGAGSAMGLSNNEHLETAAPLAVAGIHAPQMLEEGRAWISGDGALKDALRGSDVSDASSIQNKFRGRGAAMYGSYGLAGASNILTAKKAPDIRDYVEENFLSE